MYRKNKYLIVLVMLFNFLLPLQAETVENRDYLSIYIEAIAKSMLGKAYKWGGNGPYYYDCSGFTKEVFEENGIEIPRNSWNQAKVGIKITKRSQLKKGDLVFFTSKNHTRVNHVGIYLGNGKFIHASRFHHRIVISPLREYKKYFKWGRRLT
jgi:cell wall-associated NlpC family hydrolase